MKNYGDRSTGTRCIASGTAFCGKLGAGLKTFIMKRLLLTSFVLALGFWATGALAASASQAEAESAWLAFANARGEESLIRGDVEHPTANDIFRPIPVPGGDELDEEKLQLGFDLFNDPRLSRDGTVACSSCHIGMLGGVDRRPISFGVDGSPGTMNAPTVFNAALNFRQFWDGRALTLQDQALMPIENEVEMDHDLESVIATLKSIPEYTNAFDRFYPDGITAANLGNVISYYETMNFTGMESPFLRQFDEGQVALSEQARRGQQRFVEVGCASCHNGVNLGGNSYQELGVATSWFNQDRPADEADHGLLSQSGREQDRHVFKVPTLHNVAITGPWFHDGSVTTLQQAVDLMARYQSGRYLDNRDIDDIVAFLRTLHDSMALIGDCAASGNYGVTLDCDVKKRTSNSPGVDTSTTILADAEELTAHHAQQYQAALDRVGAAEQRIGFEMDRIHSGEVAHYDFLQYEHLEMLRHARALSHPPINLSSTQRAAALEQAEHWQQTAREYEFSISDFLRRHAIANSARLNYQDLLRTFASEADEKTLQLLSQAEASVLRFYSSPDEEAQEQLEKATSVLEDLNLSTVLLEELQVQVSLMIASLTG